MKKVELANQPNARLRMPGYMGSFIGFLNRPSTVSNTHLFDS